MPLPLTLTRPQARNAQILRGYRRARPTLARFAIQESERQRLAQELHDGVCQDLASILWDWPERQDDASIERCRERISAVLAELRNLSHSVSPSVVDRLGLAGALRTLSSCARPTVCVDVTGTVPDALAPGHALSIFRIAQEAVHNARKHSGATRIDVSLECSSQSPAVRLTVRDNGRGFDVQRSATGSGLGLTHMRQRAESIGGKLRYLYDPHQGGVTVLLESPLESRFA